MRKSIVLVLFLCTVLLSCTTAGTRKTVSGPTGNLGDTVNTFYELRKEGRFAETWSFERMSQDENAERRENTRRTYISKAGMGAPAKDYKILEIGKEGSGTEGFTPVRVKITTEWPPLPFPTPQGDRELEFEDLWEKIDGKWYHVVRGVNKFW
jgi:hypothetical protein